MAGLSPKLPVTKNEEDGYSLNKTYKSMIAQNLKHLVLTNPGERMMDPLFGVGITRFLFEPATGPIRSEISKRIYQQVSKYMPFVNITNVEFPGFGDSFEAQENTNYLKVRISYAIPAINAKDRISVVTSAQNTAI